MLRTNCCLLNYGTVALVQGQLAVLASYKGNHEFLGWQVSRDWLPHLLEMPKAIWSYPAARDLVFGDKQNVNFETKVTLTDI